MESPIAIDLTPRIWMDRAARLWFVVTLFGQWFFVYYIAGFYGKATLEGDFQRFNEALLHGIIAGDILGNAFLLLHLLLAFVITFGGPLQLFPVLQRRFKTFHRWNGRLYILTAILIAFSGLFMISTRSVTSAWTSIVGQWANASLIIVFSILAWRTAVKGNITAHRKWAIRSFLMVSGVWFMRVAYGFWILVNSGSAPGSNENFDGPFDIFLAFGHWCIPLLLVELYFWAQESRDRTAQYTLAGILLLAALFTASGLVITTQAFWLRFL